MVVTGSQLYKRKQVQPDRAHRNVKRVAKTKQRSGQLHVERKETDPTTSYEEATASQLPALQPFSRPIPAAWNCKMSDAAVDKFVVLEV